ncbi:MAG TPA: serine/threonine protein kinase [Desulfocapsa sulfexigens]|nr:serine/threonine protein kinase [Desulfocapsa sulfexigens]
MNYSEKNSHPGAFPELSPNTVLNLVEAALDIPCSNLCRPLNSYINRVFELEAADGGGLVVKFYRPGRWSKAALQDEHDFLLELDQQEIPVIPPLKLHNGETLGEYQNFHFSVFPRCGGRSYDEFNEEQWMEIGRLLGRCHAIGAVHPSCDRMTMLPNQSTEEQIQYILKSGLIQQEPLVTKFSSLCSELLTEISPLFEGTPISRIHGDCHFSNIIYRPGESFFLIDFDDMVMGPPIQDLWMLLPGTPRESLLEIDYFLEGYETFHHLDKRTFNLIEPLRAMRFLHYIAWLTHQYLADGSTPIIPDFASREYWAIEIADLEDQLKRIRKNSDSLANMF